MSALIAAQAIISAWDRFGDSTESASDDVLQAAAAYTKALLVSTPNRVPDEIRVALEEAVAVISADPNEPPDNLPNLSFDEAIEPLRKFVRQPRQLGEILGPTENVGSIKE